MRISAKDPDAKARAEKLDEGLDVVTGLWRGEPFSYSGKHYRIYSATLLPAPVQQPRIPIWVAGVWPAVKAPFRRAARWDGVQPIFDTGLPPERIPDEVRQMVAYIRAHRPGDVPFEVVLGAETAGDGSAQDADRVQAYAESGVTWWLEAINHWCGPPSTMRERICKGPPRVGR